jgi:hypothetical protein
MSLVRTKPTESEPKRDVKKHRAGTERVTRAEFSPSEPMLVYINPSGGNRKWCALYYGGETTAGF